MYRFSQFRELNGLYVRRVKGYTNENRNLVYFVTKALGQFLRYDDDSVVDFDVAVLY